MVGDTEQVSPEQRVLVWIYWSDVAEVQALHAPAVWRNFLSGTIAASAAP